MSNNQGGSTRAVTMTVWSRTAGGKQPVNTFQEARAFHWERVVAVAEQQPGFKNALLLTDQDAGETMSLTIWDSESEMEAAEANEDFRRVMDEFVGLFAKPLPVRHYETQQSSSARPSGIELDVHASCCPDGELSLKWSAH